MTGSLCIIGVGSPHGDDQAGWRVIERLRMSPRIAAAKAKIAAAQTPADIPMLLEGSEELFLIDACQGSGEPGAIYRFTWPDERVEKLRFSLAHTLSLDQAVELAAAIGKAPARCEIWCIEGAEFAPHRDLSVNVAKAVDQAASRLAQMLLRKRRGQQSSSTG